MRSVFVSLFASAVLAISAHAQSITPSDLDLTVNPGDVVVQNIEVCIPGSPSGKADIYFLCDTTGSMGPVINQVKANANTIVNNLFGRTIDIQIGVGNYKDFPFDLYCFQHQQSPTDNAAAVVAAINAWSADGGSDTPEGQFFALHKLATDEDGTIQWRAGAKRIIVWFGDAPGHDPICTAISGDAHAVTEASLTAELVASGPGGATVIAVDSGNLDGSGSAGDYGAACGSSNIVAGQATRIAAATGGTVADIGNPAEVTAAVLDAIDLVFQVVDVSLIAQGGIIPFVTSIVPPVHEDVILPTDPTQQVCVTFQVTFTGQACVENSAMVTGSLLAQAIGPLAEAPVVLQQPECSDAICLLLVGTVPTALPMSAVDVKDVLLTVPVFQFPVLTNSTPSWVLPNDPALIGKHTYMQVLMVNDGDFPTDAMKTSNGLDLALGVGVSSYGGSSGFKLWLDSDPLLGATVKPRFKFIP